MLLLSDLGIDLPLSEPQVSHPIQRGLVSGDRETNSIFALGSMMARDPSHLNGLWGYGNKAVQLTTKTFLHYSCLYISAFLRALDGP